MEVARLEELLFLFLSFAKGICFLHCVQIIRPAEILSWPYSCYFNESTRSA
jgi:hypothetical protein